MNEHNKNMIVGAAVVVIAAIFALMSALVMLLWNTVLVDVAPVAKLTYWQAVGVFVLARLMVSNLNFTTSVKK